MSEKLEAYLEDISHFLSGRAEREEILSEIRSHILEKAEQEYGGVDDASLDKVIAAYGPARRVADKYLVDRPIIAPVYKRFLFRYTTLLFACHAVLTLVAVIFRKSFVLFPFVFMPRLGVFEAVMYLPTAFLADLGLVALVLCFITQSGKNIKLPWPKLGVDLDEVTLPKKKALVEKIAVLVGFGFMLALTNFAAYLFLKFKTVLFINMDFIHGRPLLNPEPGRRVSLIIIAMFAAGTISLFFKIFTKSRWVDLGSNVVSLVLISLLLSQPFDNLIAVSINPSLLPKIKFGLKFILIFIAAATAIDLIKNLTLIGRRKLAK